MMHVLGIVPNTLRRKSVVFAILYGGSYQREVYSRPPYNLANTFWECLQIREKFFSDNAQPRNAPRNNYF